MKILLAILLFPLLLQSQFSKIYDTDLSKDAIKQKTEEWIVLNFKDSNEVIKLNNENKIISKGYFDIGYKVYFSFIVSFKEKKYKLEIKNYTINNISIAPDYSFEDHKKIMQDGYNHLSSKSSKKYYEKKYLTNEALQKSYSKKNNSNKLLIKQIKNRSEQTAKSLNNYILNNTESW